MALDIHKLNNNEYILGLDDEYYSCLSPIFEQFKYSTGLYIDQYGDITLSVKNFQFLIKLIDKYVQNTDLNKDKHQTIKILEFRGLLNMLIKYDIPVKLYGD